MYILLFLVANISKATSIVATRIPGAIVVGADSAGMFEGGHAPTHTNPVCKVYEQRNMFFAVAGLAMTLWSPAAIEHRRCGGISNWVGDR